MTTFNTTTKSYCKIYAGQKHFNFSPDGVKLVPRASFEILKECPADIRDMVCFAIAKGYIQPVVHMPEDEYMWHDLRS